MQAADTICSGKALNLIDNKCADAIQDNNLNLASVRSSESPSHKSNKLGVPSEEDKLVACYKCRQW